MLQPLDPKILKFLTVHNKIFIAYSGGVDSHVLLHFFNDIFKNNKQVQLTAIHVNHNVNPNSKKWANHCWMVCKKLGIDCIIKEVDGINKVKGKSLEDHLRQLRYESFIKILSKNACLVTAHHKDDQAETLLLQLFRGSGPKGLAAMPGVAKFTEGYLVRPFLQFSRTELLLYAKKHRLKWIEDESNLNPKFDRNFIRHKLIPTIEKKWSGVTTVLNRATRHLAETNDLLEELARLDLKLITDVIKNTLNRAKLQKLSTARQKNILRFWLKQNGFSMPSEVKLKEVIKNIVNSRYDAIPIVGWDGVEIRRHRNDIYVMSPLLEHDNKQTFYFAKNKLELLGGLRILEIKISKKIDFKKLKVTFRQGGERVKISGRNTRNLKKLMQEWDILPWMRDRVPLIWYANEIIAVVGYYSVDWIIVNLSDV